MKVATVFLAALGGGIVGGILVRLSTDPTTSDPVTSSATADEQVERIRQASVQLDQRVQQLEEAPAAPGLEVDSSGGLTVTPALQEALLPLMREVVRAEMDTSRVTAGESDPGPREVVLARALEQLSAPHEDTRRNAIRSLHRMIASEASPRVLPMLEDESSLVRRQAAAYFEDMWDPAAFEPLVAMMNSGDDTVAEQALDALCKSGMEEAIVELEACFLRNTNLDLAYEAGKALEENQRPDVLPHGVSRFRSAMGSTAVDERRLGTLGVGRWGSAAVDEARVRALTADANPRVRAAAERALERWGLPPGG